MIQVVYNDVEEIAKIVKEVFADRIATSSAPEEGEEVAAINNSVSHRRKNSWRLCEELEAVADQAVDVVFAVKAN